MIKVRVGQVWQFDFPIGGITKRTVRNVIRKAPYHDDVFFECGNYVSTRYMTSAKYIPQNDLEKIAINETEWFHSDCDWVRLDEYDRPMYTSEIDHPLNQDYHYTHRAEWQNMRYHLGLDKKPHYRLTGGDWVKV